MHIQSVVFPKSRFTQKQALKWLYEHGYKYNKIDITHNMYRFRQHDPSGLSYYTKVLPNGVHLIVEKL